MFGTQGNRWIADADGFRCLIVLLVLVVVLVVVDRKWLGQLDPIPSGRHVIVDNPGQSTIQRTLATRRALNLHKDNFSLRMVGRGGRRRVQWG